MAQAIQSIKLMPIDHLKPYYTIQPRKNHVLKAQNQVLQVVSGTAWVSVNGQDFVLKSGEAVTLEKGGDAVVAVSGLFGKPVQYTLTD